MRCKPLMLKRDVLFSMILSRLCYLLFKHLLLLFPLSLHTSFSTPVNTLTLHGNTNSSLLSSHLFTLAHSWTWCPYIYMPLCIGRACCQAAGGVQCFAGFGKSVAVFSVTASWAGSWFQTWRLVLVPFFCFVMSVHRVSGKKCVQFKDSRHFPLLLHVLPCPWLNFTVPLSSLKSH